MKKTIMFLSIFIIILTLSSCEKEPLKVGFTGNLTDTGSELGTSGMYGAYLAVDHINEDGGLLGKAVELLVEDDKKNPNDALVADKNLIEAGVVGIIGHMLSSTGNLREINSEEMIMISPTISSPSFAYQDDYFYTLNPITSFQSEAITLALSDTDATNIGILYEEENQAYSYTLAQEINTLLDNQGLSSVMIEPFLTSKTTEFAELLSSLESKNLDALVVIGPAFDVSKFSQYFYTHNIDLPIYLTTWSMTNELLTMAGPTANGIHAVNPFDRDSDTLAFEKFRIAYMEKYGLEPTFASTYTYEAVILLAQAIESTDSTDSNVIKSYLDNLQSFEGLQGMILLDQYGDAQRSFHLYEVVDEKYVKVKTYE